MLKFCTLFWSGSRFHCASAGENPGDIGDGDSPAIGVWIAFATQDKFCCGIATAIGITNID